MTGDNNKPNRPEPGADGARPYWADDPSAESNLPEGFPERPDLQKVKDLRSRIRQEKRVREEAGRGRLLAKFDKKVGKQARAIGSYTLIPMMMLAGPAVGYGLGWLLEKQFGGKPWVGVAGVLLGLAAAFQQIILLLKNSAPKD